MSISKLLKSKAITDTKQPNSNSYFCSELAASLYRYLGLIDPNKSEARYWPRDFADGNGLQLLNGCSLDAERQLIF